MNIFVGASPPASNEGVWFKDGVDPFVWDADVNRWVSVGNRNMKTQYKFGLMLEQIEEESGCGQIWVKGKWVPVMVYWRVFSARLHGPLMLTPASAFFAWLKNWITDCVRTKRRHTPDSSTS